MSMIRVLASVCVLAVVASALRAELDAVLGPLREANHAEPWNQFAIDLGAGVRDDDPMFALYDAGWGGIMVDGEGSG